MRSDSLASNRPILEQFGLSWQFIANTDLVSVSWVYECSMYCRISEIFIVSSFVKMEIVRISEIHATQRTVVLKHFQICGDIDTFSFTNTLQGYKWGWFTEIEYQFSDNVVIVGLPEKRHSNIFFRQNRLLVRYLAAFAWVIHMNQVHFCRIFMQPSTSKMHPRYLPMFFITPNCWSQQLLADRQILMTLTTHAFCDMELLFHHTEWQYQKSADCAGRAFETPDLRGATFIKASTLAIHILFY